MIAHCIFYIRVKIGNIDIKIDRSNDVVVSYDMAKTLNLVPLLKNQYLVEF